MKVVPYFSASSTRIVFMKKSVSKIRGTASSRPKNGNFNEKSGVLYARRTSPRIFRSCPKAAMHLQSKHLNLGIAWFSVLKHSKQINDLPDPEFKIVGSEILST
jgi:hypothetical protein